MPAIANVSVDALYAMFSKLADVNSLEPVVIAVGPTVRAPVPKLTTQKYHAESDACLYAISASVDEYSVASQVLTSDVEALMVVSEPNVMLVSKVLKYRVEDVWYTAANPLVPLRWSDTLPDPGSVTLPVPALGLYSAAQSDPRHTPMDGVLSDIFLMMIAMLSLLSTAYGLMRYSFCAQ